MRHCCFIYHSQNGQVLAPFPGRKVARGSTSLISPLFFINHLYRKFPTAINGYTILYMQVQLFISAHKRYANIRAKEIAYSGDPEFRIIQKLVVFNSDNSKCISHDPADPAITDSDFPPCPDFIVQYNEAPFV